jgi:hypothetical protein
VGFLPDLDVAVSSVDNAMKACRFLLFEGLLVMTESRSGHRRAFAGPIAFALRRSGKLRRIKIAPHGLDMELRHGHKAQTSLGSPRLLRILQGQGGAGHQNAAWNTVKEIA